MSVARQRVEGLVGGVVALGGPVVIGNLDGVENLWDENLPETISFLVGVAIIVWAYRHDLLAVMGIKTPSHTFKVVKGWLEEQGFSVAEHQHPEEVDAAWLLNAIQTARPAEGIQQWHFGVMYRPKFGTVGVRSIGFFGDRDNPKLRVPKPDVAEAFGKELAVQILSLGNLTVGFHRLANFKEGRIEIDAELPASGLDRFAFLTQVHLVRRAHMIAAISMGSFARAHLPPASPAKKAPTKKAASPRRPRQRPA